MELLEEEYRIQQNLLFNNTSKFESLNHLLNQVEIKNENIRNSLNHNNNENFNIRNSINQNQEIIKSNNSFKEKKDLDLKNGSNCKKEFSKNYLKSEEILENKFKEMSHKIMNVNTDSSNNDNSESMNSGKYKKSNLDNTNYSKINNNGDDNKKGKYTNVDKLSSMDPKYINKYKTLSENFEDNNINTQSEQNSFQNKDFECNLKGEGDNETMKFVYERNDTSENIELEEILSYQILCLDMTRFPLGLLEKLTDGKLDFYENLTQEYIKEKFSQIVDEINQSKNLCNKSQMSSSSKNNSCCPDSSVFVKVNKEDEDIAKNSQSLENKNLRNVKFSNKMLINLSMNNNQNKLFEDNYENKNNEDNSGSNQDSNSNNNHNNLNFDLKNILNSIIQELSLITNIKFEKIERVTNLLIKLNYVNKNIKLRENFIFEEYPETKKFLIGKIIHLEKRLDAKFEKVKSLNFFIKKSESKLAEINKTSNIKKNELEENRNYLNNLEKEKISMKEIESSLKISIDKLMNEKQNLENDYKAKISEIEKENKKIEEKLEKKRHKLKLLNDNKMNLSINSIEIKKKNLNNNNSVDDQARTPVSKSLSLTYNSCKNKNYLTYHSNVPNENDDINYNKHVDHNFVEKSNKKIKESDINQKKEHSSSSSSVNKYKRKRNHNTNKNNDIKNNHNEMNFYKENFQNNFPNDRNFNLNNNLNNRDQDNSNHRNFEKNNNPSSSVRKDIYYFNDEEGCNNQDRPQIEDKGSNRTRDDVQEFRINNNIYKKYHYPSENRSYKNRNLLIDSRNKENKSENKFKMNYLFENYNKNFNKDNFSNSNKNNSFSSRRSNRDSMTNYNCSPNNFNNINKSSQLSKNYKSPNIERKSNERDEDLELNHFQTPLKDFNSDCKNNLNYKREKNLNTDNRYRKSNLSIKNRFNDNELNEIYNDNKFKRNDFENKNEDNSESLIKRRKSKITKYSNSSRSSSKVNFLRRSQTKNHKDKYGKSDISIDNRDKNNNPNIINKDLADDNNFREREGVYYHEENLYRRLNNESFKNFYSRNNIPERLSNDKSRYLITNDYQNNDDTGEASNNIYKYNHSSRLPDRFNYDNYYNAYYKNVSQVENSNDILLANQEEENNKENSPGAAYKKKGNTISMLEKNKYEYYDNNRDIENDNDRNFDKRNNQFKNVCFNKDQSVNSNISARNFKLEQQTSRENYPIEFNRIENDFNNPKFSIKKNIDNSIKNMGSKSGPMQYLNHVYPIQENSLDQEYVEYDKNNNSTYLRSPNGNLSSNFSSNEFHNTNRNRSKNNNFSNFDTTVNSNCYQDNILGSKFRIQNNPNGYLISLENSRKTTNKSIYNDNFYNTERDACSISQDRDLSLYKSFNEPNIGKEENLSPNEKRKINLLNLNYEYPTAKAGIDTYDSFNNHERFTVTHSNKLNKNYETNTQDNMNYSNNYNLLHSARSNFEKENNKHYKINSNESNECVYNNYKDKTIRFSRDEDYHEKYKKRISNDTNSKISNKRHFLSNPTIENPNVKNCYLDYHDKYIDKIAPIEKGCFIFKRNNYFGSKNSDKISTYNLQNIDFNPLNYGYKKYFCAYDSKKCKIKFTKEGNLPNRKIADLKIAGVTSIKIPQYTKNLVFIKQIYKKFLKNFETLEQMDEYISNNTHFLVSLYYNNCKEKEVKFDNRLYSKEFRRELLNNQNFIVYLNLLADNHRIEIMFLEYEDFKHWVHGLQEIVSLNSW